MSYEEALRLQEEERYEEANQMFMKLQNSNLQAAIILAVNIYSGLGIAKDRARSYDIFERIINRTQNLRAIEIYSKFRYQDQDIFLPSVSEAERYESMTRAFTLLEFAVVFGSQDFEVYLCLGRCYESGYGTISDKNKAIEYYQIALQLTPHDNVQIILLFKIGRLQLFNTNTLEKAIKNLQISAERGNTAAYVYLGRIFYEGKIAEKDDSSAYFYFSMAAKNGIVEGQFYLAEMYEKGIEKVVEKNLKKAIDLYFAVAMSLCGRNDVIIESLPNEVSLPENCERIDQRALEKLKIYKPEILSLIEKIESCGSKSDSCTVSYFNRNYVIQKYYACDDLPNFQFSADCICENCMKKCFSKHRLVDNGIGSFFCDCFCNRI